MKLSFVLKIIAGVVFWSCGALGEENILGCVDCFNFAAPAVSGAENISAPQTGLIVLDSYYGGFRGFNYAGNWVRLSNDKYVRTLTANTTLAAADDVVLSNASSSAFSVTLPSAVTYPGKILSFKKVDSSTNQLTINPSASQTIDGATSKKIYFQNDVAQIISDGSNWQDMTQKGFHPPTVSVATSSSHSGGFSANGSGTYTLPAGVLYIRVRMVGGGGGGAGSGTASWGAASSGASTSFGSSFLTAGGGNPGGQSGNAAGGTVSVGSGAVGIWSNGASGTGSNYNNSSGAWLLGGTGGGTPIAGGGGGGSYNVVGQAAPANSGAGGGGGGINGTAGNYSGGGGRAGGFIDVVVGSPGSSYSYSVGNGGIAGGAGTNGQSGGAGAAGTIEVTEYYQ